VYQTLLLWLRNRESRRTVGHRESRRCEFLLRLLRQLLLSQLLLSQFRWLRKRDRSCGFGGHGAGEILDNFIEFGRLGFDVEKLLLVFSSLRQQVADLEKERI
jgi:hypothetical protein